MKKCLLFSLVCFIFVITHAQLEVYENSNVGIGTSSQPSEKLKVQGTMRVTGNVTFENPYTGILIESSSHGGYARTIRPENTNTCTSGTSTKAWYQMWAHNTPSPSDLRIKENIQNISGALDRLSKLRGVKYDLRVTDYPTYLTSLKETNIEKYNSYFKNKYGFVAQEVKEIIPEVVIYDEENDMYGIDYVKLVPVLVEAIKEQQDLIKQQNEKIATLYDKMKSID